MGSPNPGFDFMPLIQIVNTATTSAKNQITTIQGESSQVSIGDMFNMQMIMNKLSQLSEMVTNVMAAANQSTLDMARNVK
jgi:hypothetical protein